MFIGKRGRESPLLLNKKRDDFKGKGYSAD